MTTGKRQPPLWIDMSFTEALERFGRADPKDMAVDLDQGASAVAPGDVANKRHKGETGTLRKPPFLSKARKGVSKQKSDD